MARLKGRDERAVKAFFNSVELTYCSYWTIEREGDYKKACDFNFRRPFTSSSMDENTRKAYLGMFIKELVNSHVARWIIWVDSYFADGPRKMYIEQRELVSDQECKINDVVTIMETFRDEAKQAGNQRQYLFYTWRAEVYKDQQRFETLDEDIAA